MVQKSTKIIYLFTISKCNRTHNKVMKVVSSFVNKGSARDTFLILAILNHFLLNPNFRSSSTF